MSDADVIVLGAGVIGAAIAFELSAAGRRVRVIEVRGPGRGATQASAGVLAPYIEGHHSETLTTLGRRSLDLYDDFVGRVVRSAGRAVAHGRIGTLEIATDEHQASQLRESAERLTGHHIDATWMSGPSVAEVEPAVTTSATGALLIPSHGFVSAPDLIAALIDAASHHRTIFEHGTRAISVESTGAAVRVFTDSGQWEAAHVIVAAGSWSGQIAVPEVVTAPVRPVRGQLLVLRLADQLLRHIVWGSDCYLVPWPDGTVLLGATMEDVGFDERATVTGVRGLLEAARRLVPALEEATFEGVRVGLRPAGPDHLPLVGASSTVPGLVYAAGHFRNGVLLAPLTARLVSEIVGGKTSDPALAALAPARAGL